MALFVRLSWAKKNQKIDVNLDNAFYMAQERVAGHNDKITRITFRDSEIDVEETPDQIKEALAMARIEAG